jgi:hypothetical protein
MDMPGDDRHQGHAFDEDAEGCIMTKRIKVAGISDLAAGSGTTVDVEGQRIALFNVQG